LKDHDDNALFLKPTPKMVNKTWLSSSTSTRTVFTLSGNVTSFYNWSWQTTATTAATTTTTPANKTAAITTSSKNYKIRV